MIKPFLSLVLVALTLSLGCKKPADSSASSEPRTAPAKASIENDPGGAPPPPPPPAAAPGEPVPVADNSPGAPAGTETEGRNGFLDRVYSSDPAVAIKAMNQFIDGRNMTATTPLTSLEQLVKEGGWPKTPKAPPGMRYALDPKTGLVIVVQ